MRERIVRKGMVRDAATARAAAEINVIVRGMEDALSFHIVRATEGEYGGRCGTELLWDLAALKARLHRIRELVSGSGAEFVREGNFKKS